MGLVACAAEGAPCPAAPPPPAAPQAAAAASPDQLPGGEPILRMPFERDVVAFCQQGNASPPGRSHAYPNALHALDLSTPGTSPTRVVAAARGKVIRVVTGAVAGATAPGGGFGNQVVIEHPDGYKTLYAHLADVSVTEGQAVESGSALGTMGDTGQAGNVHLHFSLHRDPFPAEGAPATVPIHALVTADVAGDLAIGIASSLELVCADSNLSLRGHAYVSENALGAPITAGALPEASRVKVTAAREAIFASIGALDPVAAALAKMKERGPERTRAELREVLLTSPENPGALYWVAVISLRDLDDRAAAREALAKLDGLVAKGPAWLAPWLLVRKAELAEKEGRVRDARALYREARSKAPEGDAELATFLGEAEQRLGGR